MRGCSIRAIWILKSNSNVFFSRRFPTVERQWQRACSEARGTDSRDPQTSSPALPSDVQIAELIAERKAREGSIQSSAIRESWSVEGTDSWVDEPITRHIISLDLKTGEKDVPSLLWPLVLHSKGQYQILVLPLIEPHQLAAYEDRCRRHDCGGPHHFVQDNENNLSSMMLGMPCITGALAVAYAIGDVVTGEVAEPDMHINPPATTLLDSLAGGIGIAAGIASRAKPVAAPVTAAASAVAAAAGQATSVITGAHSKIAKSVNKEAVRKFISGAMPFGTPLDLNVANLNAIRTNGFSAMDVPPAEQKLPAWKPYLYRGKPKLVFAVHEIITAALYDRDDVADVITLGGQILCRADLEGLPEVSVPVSCQNPCADALSFHPCAQATEHVSEKHRVTFSPPLGNFVLARYQGLPAAMQLPLQGFYQLSMVSDDEGAFLIRMKLAEGYKAPMVLEYCTLSLPFPRRKIISIDGTPSSGTFITTDHLIEWRIAASTRSIFAKATEVSFPGTIKFSPTSGAESLNNSDKTALYSEEEAEAKNVERAGDYYDGNSEKGDTGLPIAQWEDAFTWDAYSYAKASLKLVGGTVSGLSIDPKAVTVYPATKVTTECFSQVVSGEYIFWNSLGRYPQSSNTNP